MSDGRTMCVHLQPLQREWVLYRPEGSEQASSHWLVSATCGHQHCTLRLEPMEVEKPKFRREER